MGRLLSSFFDIEPAPFPGMEDSKAEVLKNIKDKFIDARDRKLDKEAGVKTSKQQAREREIATKKKEYGKKKDSELRDIIDDPETSKADRELAKSILDDPERKETLSRKVKANLNKMSDKQLKDLLNDPEATEREKQIAKELMSDRKKDAAEDEVEDAAESYKSLMSTIKEMSEPQAIYKNLHTVVKEITNE